MFLGIDQLTAAFMADIFPDQFGNLHGGFDLGMPLTLDITVNAGTEQIRGVKRVLYWAQRINDTQLANQTPTIDTLSGFYDRDEATFEPMDEPTPIPPVDELNPTFLVTAGKRSIWIMPSPGTAESYQTTVIDPDTHRAVPFTVERETLRYRFFATAGTFNPQATSSERNPAFDVKAPIRIESEYTLPDRRPDRDRRGRAGGGDDLGGRARRPRRRILAAAPALDHALERLARRRRWRHARAHVELSEGEVARPR